MIKITEDFRGDLAQDGMADETNLRIDGTGDREFDVDFDSGASSAAALRAIDSVTGFTIPVMYQLYPGEPWLFVTSREATRPSPQSCRVHIGYSSINDPLLANPVWSWNSEISDEPIDRDINGAALTNSSGEAWDPPITRKVYDLVLSYQRNEAIYVPLIAADFQDSVNSFEFLGFPAGKVKCTKIGSQQARAAATVYFSVNYEFVVRVDATDTWIRRFVDEGFRVKDDTETGETGESIKDVEGVAVTSPVLLDGSGAKLATGLPPVFLEYDIVKFRDLNDLNIILA